MSTEKPVVKIGNAKNKWLVGLVTAALIGGASMWEGEKQDPYFDIVGILTVCDGETQGIVKDKHYTHAECQSMLKTRLGQYGESVLKCVKVPLSENQYNAFTLFTYNVGGAAFCGSGLLKKLNAGDYVGGCNGLLAWDHAGGKKVKGLTKRREFERSLCLRGST